MFQKAFAMMFPQTFAVMFQQTFAVMFQQSCAVILVGHRIIPNSSSSGGSCCQFKSTQSKQELTSAED